ncbi:MAG TPA: MarR family transcriptional regulator [Terriglobales bacterium]|nr:MarR family transcriptional regulator [Terriglobales bacterium]
MRKRKSPAPVEELASRLHSAAIHLLRHVRKADSATGEGPARLSALSVLVFAGPMPLGKLAAAEQVKPPTMTRIAAGLEKSGLVERVGDAGDGRRVLIAATAKGKQLLLAGQRHRVESLARELRTIPPKDLHSLQKAITALEKIFPPHSEKKP